MDDDVDPLIEAATRAARALANVTARAITAASPDLTVPQFRALVALASGGPHNLGELATVLDMQPPSTSRLCDRLVRKKLIDRRPSPTSGRAIEVELTDRGATVVAAIFEQRTKALHKLAASLPAATRDLAHDALVAIADAADGDQDFTSVD